MQRMALVERRNTSMKQHTSSSMTQSEHYISLAQDGYWIALCFPAVQHPRNLRWDGPYSETVAHWQTIELLILRALLAGRSPVV